MGQTYRTPSTSQKTAKTSITFIFYRCMGLTADSIINHRNLAKVCKGLAPGTQNDFRHAMTHVGMSRSAMCLPRKTTLPLLEPSKMKGFAAFPIGKATPQENPRIETRHVGGSKRAFRTRPPQIFTSCSYKKSHQFSSCVTNCQACHAICTLSTLDAAVTVIRKSFRSAPCVGLLLCREGRAVWHE